MKIGCYVKNTYVGAIGYADDLFLISPTLDGLQDMLLICEKYADKHNLKFSTDPNPLKSKTKCMAFFEERKITKRTKTLSKHTSLSRVWETFWYENQKRKWYIQ